MRLLTPFLIVSTLVLAACGSGDEQDARALLRQTFSDAKPVQSGKVDLQLAVVGDGLPQVAPGGLKLGLKGPFESRGDGQTPRFDLDLSLGSGDATLRAGAISIGDKGWLKLQGTAYTLSKDTFAKLLAQQGKDDKQGPGGLKLSSLGVDPETWLRDPEVVGREKVGADDADHVRGQVDVPTLLEDVSTLLQKAGTLGVPGAPQTPTQLTDEQRAKVAKSITKATVDVWTGAQDRRLRRLLVVVSFDVPEAVRGKGKPEQKGTVRLDLRLTDLDAKQPIGAPADPRPFSELQAGLAALGGAMAQEQGGAAPAPGAPAPAQPAPGEAAPAQPAPAQPAPGGGAQQQDAYGACLEQAQGDLRAQQACAELLTG